MGVITKRAVRITFKFQPPAPPAPPLQHYSFFEIFDAFFTCLDFNTEISIQYGHLIKPLKLGTVENRANYVEKTL